MMDKKTLKQEQEQGQLHRMSEDGLVDPSHTIPNTDITGLGTMSTQSADAVAITGGSITGLSAPVNPSDAVTKAYADSLKLGGGNPVPIPDHFHGPIQTPDHGHEEMTKAYAAAYKAGLDVKESVRLSSTENIDVATGTLLTIDGVKTIAGNRVLLKNQTIVSENGIYVAGDGAWLRAIDANDTTKLTSNMYAFVSEGTVNSSSGFRLSLPEPIAPDTTALTNAYVEAGKVDVVIKESVRVASTDNVDIMTGNLLTIDGTHVVVGDRVLLKNQADPSQNGIYIAADGPWMRSLDTKDSATSTSDLYTFVSEGTVNASNGFALATADPIVVGTTALPFTQFK